MRKRADRLTNTGPVVNDPSGACNYARGPNRAADLARARAASASRSRGSAAVTRASTRTRAVAATSSTARSKAALLALDGVLKPLSFLTNWSDAARISSSDAGGWKLNSVLMFLHISWSPPVGRRHWPRHDSGLRWREICGNWLCSVVVRRAKLQRTPLGKLLNLQSTSSQRNGSQYRGRPG
jgi:hypothetical protein